MARPRTPSSSSTPLAVAVTLTVSQVCVSSMREAQELLRRAAKARQSSGTNANERSSRSHAVITVSRPVCRHIEWHADSYFRNSTESVAVVVWEATAVCVCGGGGGDAMSKEGPH